MSQTSALAVIHTHGSLHCSVNFHVLTISLVRNSVLRINLGDFFCHRPSLDCIGRQKSEMENLAPPLKCLIVVRTCLENGDATIAAVKKYLQSIDDDFSVVVARWLFELEQGVSPSRPKLTPQRKVLLDVLKAGAQGQPIHARLLQLEEDFIQTCNDQMIRDLDILPLKMLIPLMLFQFPAYLFLLFGPLLDQFMRSLSE